MCVKETKVLVGVGFSYATLLPFALYIYTSSKDFRNIFCQLMAATALSYLAAWGPFCVLCLWEMVVMPQVKSLTQYSEKS